MSKKNPITLKLITDKDALFTKKNKNTGKEYYYTGKVDIDSSDDSTLAKFKIVNPVKLHLSSEKYESLSNGNNHYLNHESSDDSLSDEDINNSLSEECTQKQSDYLRNFIRINYNNIVVLAGAGSSISNSLNSLKKQKKSKNIVSKLMKKDIKSGLTMYSLADNINKDLIKYNNKNKNNKDIKKDDNENSYYNLLQMANIAKFFRVNKKILDKYIKDNPLSKNDYKNFKKEYNSENYNNSQIEDLTLIFNNFELLLSTVIAYENFIKYIKQPQPSKESEKSNDNDNKRINPKVYENTITKIHDLIRDYCQLKFDRRYFPHFDFIQKLQQLCMPGKRLKIYSTNYDTLFEQAAVKLKALIIDGFNYRPERTFNENALNMDFITRGDDGKSISLINSDLYPNVVKIFQLHGSEDWYEDTKTGIVYKADHRIVTSKIHEKDKNNKKRYKPCMIFPSNNKYEQTYNDPYFDLFLNFQKDLHKKDTLLIIVGFSLGDMHIRRMVYDAMLMNKNLSMIFVSYGGVSASESKDRKTSSGNPEINVSINNNNLNKFFTSGLMSRELFYSGDLHNFTKYLDISNIYNKD